MDKSLCIKGDYLYVISKFLNPLDIVNIYRAYPPTSINLTPMFQNIVCNRIDEFFKDYFGKDYNEFRKIMIETEAIVSGSFILQIILNEHWNNTDIDIFVPSDNLYPRGSFNQLENFLYKNHEYDNVDSTNRRSLYAFIFGERCPTKVRDYQSNSDRFTFFQIISVFTDGIKRDLMKNIDFDICKNMFWYDEEGYHIYIDSVNNIINKKFTGKISNENKRKQKYESRGFNYFI